MSSAVPSRYHAKLDLPPDRGVTNKEDLYDWKVNRKRILQQMARVTSAELVHATEDAAEIRGFEITNEKLDQTYLAARFKSKDKRDDKDVIVKAILNESLEDYQLQHIHRNTYKILWFLCQTNFKNMVTIYDWFNLNNHSLVIVEEFLNYPLYAIIGQAGVLKERELRKYAEGIADAVNFLHNAGIAHQNICTSNIFIVPLTKEAKLASVEYAVTYWDADKEELIPQQLKTDVKPGQFVAPEVTSGRLYDPTKADVYSFGTLLFYMAIGRYPYDSVEAGSFEEQMTNSLQQLENRLSGLAVDLASKCVKKESDERMNIRDVVVHAWFTEALPSK